MDFQLSTQQSALREAIERHLASGDSTWPALCNGLGLGSLLLPEARSGLGGGAVEMMIAMQALGTALVATPFLETSVLCATLLDRLGGQAAASLLSELQRGEALATLAWAEPEGRYSAEQVSTQARQRDGRWLLDGGKSVVFGADRADWLIVSARTSGALSDTDGISLFLVDARASGVRRRDYATIDGRSASEVGLEGVSLPANALLGECGHAWPALNHALDQATVALAAEGVGVMRGLLEVTLAYTKLRRQFGKALAEFQVLQHRMVDMYMAIERSVSAVYLGVLKLDKEPAERGLAVSTAKATVNDALRFVGQSAIQIHGGMGMVNDGRVGQLFKRGTAIIHTHGTSDHHLARHLRLFPQAA